MGQVCKRQKRDEMDEEIAPQVGVAEMRRDETQDPGGRGARREEIEEEEGAAAKQDVAVISSEVTAEEAQEKPVQQKAAVELGEEAEEETNEQPRDNAMETEEGIPGASNGETETEEDSKQDDVDEADEGSKKNKENAVAEVKEAPPLPKYYKSDGFDYLSGLSDELLFGSIAPYLKFRELRQLAFLSKRFVQGLSYEAVLRCCQNKSAVKELLPMSECLPYSSIYVPSPVRLLRILSRRRCEQCLDGLADEQKWPGLFLCANCQQNLSTVVPIDLFQNKGWGCPELNVHGEGVSTLLTRPICSQVLGKPEPVGPVVTVQGLETVVQEQPDLIVTLSENPELLYEPLCWRNAVHTIQQAVATPPSHYDCDVFFRLLHRYACACPNCWSTTKEDCHNVMGYWNAFFSKG